MSSINDIVRRLRENRILQERQDYSNYSRDDLIRLAQEGDQLAVETLIKTHRDFIGMMANKYALDMSDREDTEQLVTIAFWTAIQDWDGSGDFEAYAGRRIKDRMTDELRKESANKAQLNIAADRLEGVIKSDGEGGEQTLGDTIPNKSAASPEERAEAEELRAVIEKYLEDEFTAEEREVVVKAVEGYKAKEIAEVLGMPHKKVDNILYKVRYKLKEYLRNNSFMESKSFRRDKDIEFSDEEKKILESALNNIKKRENIKFKARRLKESYENYTESQLDDELSNIEYEIDQIVSDMKDTSTEDRGDMLDTLEDIQARLSAMEEYLTDDQYARSEELRSAAIKAEDTDYDGPLMDPYEERGIRRSDFV